MGVKNVDATRSRINLHQQAELMEIGDLDHAESNGLWTVACLHDKQHWRLFQFAFLGDVRISVSNLQLPTQP